MTTDATTTYRLPDVLQDQSTSMDQNGYRLRPNALAIWVFLSFGRKWRAGQDKTGNRYVIVGTYIKLRSALKASRKQETFSRLFEAIQDGQSPMQPASTPPINPP